jgi:hypothetical protein
MIHYIPRRIFRSILDACLLVLFVLFLSAGVTLAEPFDQDSKSKLEKELTEVKATADYWVKTYEAWDVFFKILLVILGILSSVGATLAGTIWKDSTPPWLTVTSVVIGATITGLTAFAFSQLNFPARAQLYESKYSAADGLLLDLRFANPPPDSKDFLPALTTVYSWNDASSPTVKDVQAVLLQAQGIPSK